MADSMRSVLTSPTAAGGVMLGERDAPEGGDVLIAVEYFSLNRGELRSAPSKPAGTPIGWDLAGVVERSRTDRLAPGQRVVAFSRAQDGWAEQVAVPADDVAPIPDGVTTEVAASLPVAAGTALASLDAGAINLAGRRVLITGATGGVGAFAVQLAAAMGAHVTAQVRRDDQADAVKAQGAHEVVVTSDGAALSSVDPFRMVIDGIGGDLLSASLARLDNDGLAVTYGATGGGASVPIGALIGKGRASVRGLNLYAASQVEAPRSWLSRLLSLTAAGAVRPPIERRGSWNDVGAIASELIARKFTGKAVLAVD